jgi:D-alanine transaminase
MSAELLKANGMRDAFVYWQITRGTPTESEPLRQRVPPTRGLRAGVTVFGYCAAQPSLDELAQNGPIGKACALIEDPRWSMGHLKSTSLIGNVVAAIEADRRGEQGGEEAILVRRGTVCEGLATNVLVVTRGGELVTPSLESAPMLAGITRAILINELGRELTQRRLTSGELAEAREIMLTGSSTMVASVVRLDGRLVGCGTPGPVAARLLGVLLDAIRAGRDASAPAEHIGGCAWGGFHPRPPERD